MPCSQVKRFASALKEARSVAFRTAPVVHATLRRILGLKLAHLTSAIRDSPEVLCGRWPAVFAALQMADDELTWWALHVDSTPHDLPRKEREAERDPTAFHPVSVIALLRLAARLTAVVINKHSRLMEVACVAGCAAWACTPPPARRVACGRGQTPSTHPC